MAVSKTVTTMMVVAFCGLFLSSVTLAASCETYETCSSCISSTDSCGWCLTSGSAGCQDASTTTCAPADFLNPSSVIQSSATNSTVLSPTDVSVFLRINDPLVVTVTVTPGPIPLDLVLVEDLSGSMSDDVATLRALASDLVTRVRTEIQADTNFGIAGFIDKSYEPIAYHRDCNPQSAKENQNCWNYPYAPHLPAAADETLFFNGLNTLNNQGNRDWPESMAEGVFHAAVCTDKSGWRSNSRHIMLVSTDADTHIAGDEELLGIYKPHSSICEENYGDDSYGAGMSQGYPSASMVRDALLRANVVPVFAVTVGGGSYYENLVLYQQLVDSWGFGFVYELESDSSNIISAIVEAYSVTAETVNLIPSVDEFSWVDSVAPASGYTDALLGIGYPFSVTLLAGPGSELKTTTISLTSFGFGSVTIDATTTYACDCTGVSCPSTAMGECNGAAGTCECGKCLCDAASNFTGVDCGCDEAAPCDPPCENGLCVCGSCECFADWTGPTCDCSTLPCPGGGTCSGHGTCECGVCTNCTVGFTGFDCGCGNATACPGDGLCSGHGSCVSGACGSTCNCASGWTGDDCSCSTTPCPGLCNGHGTCVCGECNCDDDYIDLVSFGATSPCACHNVSCPIDPLTGDECGPGVCECGVCVCPPTVSGLACNCSTNACPYHLGLECAGNGTCVCGSCECAPGFTGEACACQGAASCPTAIFGLECSGHGTCDADYLCGCDCDSGWTHPPEGPEDCSCQAAGCGSSCVPPFGDCYCGACTCNVTLLESLTCDNPVCGPFGSCVVGYNSETCETFEQCLCDGSVTPVTINAATVDSYNCTCTGSRCQAPNCVGANSVNCSETCGEFCVCKPGFIGAYCQCDSSLPPTCDQPCQNGGTCIRELVTDDAADCTSRCECVAPFRGEFCEECPEDDLNCPLACTGQTCEECALDRLSSDPRLQSCSWCDNGNGNATCIKADACTAASGSIIDVCPVAQAPSPTLLENKSVFYGGIAAAALLIFAILAMLIYKIVIWRKDKQLWEKFNAKQDWGLDANPLFQEAYEANDNPLYSEEAGKADTGGDTFF